MQDIGGAIQLTRSSTRRCHSPNAFPVFDITIWQKYNTALMLNCSYDSYELDARALLKHCQSCIASECGQWMWVFDSWVVQWSSQMKRPRLSRLLAIPTWKPSGLIAPSSPTLPSWIAAVIFYDTTHWTLNVSFWSVFSPHMIHCFTWQWLEW